MNNCAWYKALNYWCNIKSPLGSGLTIPFLIGVEKVFGRGEDFDIDTLLDEFRAIGGGSSITIRFCDYIGMDVCSLDILNNEEQLNYTNFDSLFLMVNDYDDVNSFEGLKKVIEDEYSSNIQQNHFSINNGVWNDFLESDLKWLSKAT